MAADLQHVEGEIHACCEAGDYDAAATLLIEHYGREVLGFLVSRVRDRDTAGEIFSRFAEDLWRGLPAFRFACSARAWAYTLARHAASHELKANQRDRRRHVPLSRASAVARMADKVRTETLAAQKTERRTRIAALREELPADDQALLVLRINRKLEWLEIAHVLSYDGAPLAEDELKREAARLRKRFQLVKDRLRKRAAAEGLLEGESG